MEREDLARVLEQHGTDCAVRTAVALRAGAPFRVPKPMHLGRANGYFDVYAWRAQCLAEDGVVTCKDFEHALPALEGAADARVAVVPVEAPEGRHLVFLAADLMSCVAVL